MLPMVPKITFILHYFTLHSVEELTKEYLPGHESINGEYNNVAVLMCQQYMDQFPEYYSDFEEYFFPQQYFVSNSNVCDILIITYYYSTYCL